MKGVQRYPYSRSACHHAGFSLIELVTVVAILALIAGVTIAAFGPGFTSDKRANAARYEMSELRNAIERFRQDNPDFSFSTITLCTPVDVTFLLDDQYDSNGDCVADSAFAGFNPDYVLGWRGPYVSQGEIARVDIGTDLNHDGSGTPETGAIQADVQALADPFTAVPLASGVFQWRYINADASTNIDQFGRPYLLFDLDNNDARIVSLGPDGVYAGVNATDACVAEGDDLVLCLR